MPGGTQLRNRLNTLRDPFKDEVPAPRLEVLRLADAIFLEELRLAGLERQTAQAFAVLPSVQSVGVVGDVRTYENVIALRAVEAEDFMAADWSRLPHDLLARASTRIINAVKGNAAQRRMTTASRNPLIG